MSISTQPVVRTHEQDGSIATEAFNGLGNSGRDLGISLTWLPQPQRILDGEGGTATQGLEPIAFT
jgi:hypothetical protein